MYRRKVTHLFISCACIALEWSNYSEEYLHYSHHKCWLWFALNTTFVSFLIGHHGIYLQFEGPPIFFHFLLGLLIFPFAKSDASPSLPKLSYFPTFLSEHPLLPHLMISQHHLSFPSIQSPQDPFLHGTHHIKCKSVHSLIVFLKSNFSKKVLRHICFKLLTY